MKEIGKIIKNMVKESMYIKMGEFLKECMRMIREMEKGYFQIIKIHKEVYGKTVKK